jgi:hypothetical protein
VKSARDGLRTWTYAGAQGDTPEEFHRIADWLFAVLRFAVTRKLSDRASVLAAARQMDRLGARFGETHFAFFVRRSAEFCDAIAGEGGPEGHGSLRQQIKAIDDARLRRAFEAVLEIEPAEPQRRGSRRHKRQDLFKGLPPTGRRRDQESSVRPDLELLTR